MIIQLLNRLQSYPINIELTLDIDDETELRQNTSVQELTDINSIRLTNIVGTSIPNTPKNNLLLLLVPKGTRLPCRVFDEGERPISEIFWTSYNTERIEINFVTYQRHWAEALQKLTLDKINFYKWGTLLLDRDTIENNWQTGYRWVDETPPVYLAPICYNILQASQYNTEEKPFGVYTNLNSVIVTPSDLRPLISPLFILKEMFSEFGWEFRSPFYESNYGRELWAYLLSDKFGEGSGYYYKFRCSLEQQNTIEAPIPIQQRWVFINDSGTLNEENYDNSSAWQLDVFPQPNGFPNPQGYWRNQLRATARFNFKAVFKGVRHSASTKVPIKLAIEVFDDNSGISSNWNPDDIFDEAFLEPVIEAGASLDVEVIWKNAIILPRYRVRLSAYCTDENLNPTVFLDYGTYIEADVADPCLYYQDDVKFKVKSDNCLDILKGLAHPIKGIFLTDWVNKRVTLYSQKDTILPNGEHIEGYYMPIVQEIQAYNDKTFKNEVAFKTTKVGFKKSQDYLAKDNENLMVFDGENNPYNTTNNDEINFTNNYFSDVKDYLLGRNYNSPSGAIIRTSELSTDSPNFQSFDINPFIVKAIEPTEFLTLKVTSRRIEWFYDFNELEFINLENIQQFVLGTDFRESIGQVYTKIPMASQKPSAYLLKSAYNPNHFTFTGKALSLSYLFYAIALKAEKYYEVLTPFIDGSKISSETFFRYLIQTQINGLPHILRGTDILDYQTNIPVILKLTEPFIQTPDLSDSYYIKRVYKQPLNPSSNAFLQNVFLQSFIINGVEKVDAPIQVYETPIVKTDNGVSYLDNWIELLGAFLKTKFYYAGNSFQKQLISITFPKETEFSALFTEGNNRTDYRTHMVRFDNRGTWNNLNFNSGGDNYAYWEKDISFDEVADEIFKEVKE